MGWCVLASLRSFSLCFSLRSCPCLYRHILRTHSCPSFVIQPPPFYICDSKQAVASLGGAIEDCNDLFLRFNGLSREKCKTMTIFTLIHPSELHHAFESISNMITTVRMPKARPCIFASQHSNDRMRLGLRIVVVNDSNQSPSCFCVVVVKDPDRNKTAEQHVPATMTDFALLQATGDAIGRDGRPAGQEEQQAQQQDGQPSYAVG